MVMVVTVTYFCNCEAVVFNTLRDCPPDAARHLDNERFDDDDDNDDDGDVEDDNDDAGDVDDDDDGDDVDDPNDDFHLPDHLPQFLWRRHLEKWKTMRKFIILMILWISRILSP